MAAALLTTDLMTEKRRRLDALERRAARQGYDTPPEVTNEIADLKKEIGQASTPASASEGYAVLFDLVLELRRDLTRLFWLMPVLMLALCGFMVLLVRL